MTFSFGGGPVHFEWTDWFAWTDLDRFYFGGLKDFAGNEFRWFYSIFEIKVGLKSVFLLLVKRSDMPVALNATQLEILKLFRNDQTEEELQELRSLLTASLAARVTFEADKAFHENGYATTIFEKWKQEHFRKTA